MDLRLADRRRTTTDPQQLPGGPLRRMTMAAAEYPYRLEHIHPRGEPHRVTDDFSWRRAWRSGAFRCRGAASFVRRDFLTVLASMI